MGPEEPSKGFKYDVAIGIITCPRPNGVDYLGETIGDMFKRQPGLSREQVCVFSDSIERPASLPPDIQCVCSSQERLDEIKARKVRGTYNWIRSMRWQLDQGTKWCLHLEDDLLFANNWLERGLALAEYVDSSRFGQQAPFIMTLCHGTHRLLAFDYELPVIVPNVGRVAKWNKQRPHWGALAYLLKRPHAAELCELVDRETSRDRYEDIEPWLMDHAAISWSNTCGTDIYTMRPGLVQHVGNKSAAWPGMFDEENRTIRDFDDPERQRAR